MIKWAPRFVSTVGVLGLTLAIVYLFAVVISFQPEGAAIADVMIGRHSGEQGFGLVLVAIPYVLIVLHLLMRTRLAHWFASRGAHAEALEWASDRAESSFTRGRTEAESNRSASLRALIGLNRTSEAHDRLKEFAEPGGYGSIRVEGIFWRLQVALRSDDLVSANRLAELSLRGRNSTAGDVEALKAVISAREGDRDEWRNRLERAKWRKGSDALVGWARAVGVARFELKEEAPEAITSVEQGAERLDSDVPGRHPERLLVLSDLHRLAGDLDTAKKLRQSALEADLVDPRSQRLLRDLGDQET